MRENHCNASFFVNEAVLRFLLKADESFGTWGNHGGRMTAEMWDVVGGTFRDSWENGRIHIDDPKRVEGEFLVGCRVHQRGCLKPVG